MENRFTKHNKNTETASSFLHALSVTNRPRMVFMAGTETVEPAVVRVNVSNKQSQNIQITRKKIILSVNLKTKGTDMFPEIVAIVTTILTGWMVIDSWCEFYVPFMEDW